jgi:flagellar motor switch/type III secretory pathway protein FliN
MAAAEQALNVTVEVSAAVATLMIKSGVLADFTAGDSLEVDSGDDAGPMVTLFVNGKPFAIASVAKHDGRLVATIVEILSGLDQEGYNPWLLKKREAATA